MWGAHVGKLVREQCCKQLMGPETVPRQSANNVAHSPPGPTLDLHSHLIVLQVRYPASDSTLPLGLSGRTFCAVFGAQQSPLEALLVKRGLKGPSWIAIKGATRVEYSSQVCVCSQGGGG